MKTMMVGLALATTLAGCSTVAGMESKEMDQVPVKMYSEKKEMVVEVAKASIKTLGYKLQNEKAGEPTTELYFSTGMSAFSWGELGRVDVRRVADSTAVSVGMTRKDKIQLTGMSQETLAKKIFEEMDKGVAK